MRTGKSTLLRTLVKAVARLEYDFRSLSGDDGVCIFFLESKGQQNDGPCNPLVHTYNFLLPSMRWYNLPDTLEIGSCFPILMPDNDIRYACVIDLFHHRMDRFGTIDLAIASTESQARQLDVHPGS